MPDPNANIGATPAPQASEPDPAVAPAPPARPAAPRRAVHAPPGAIGPAESAPAPAAADPLPEPQKPAKPKAANAEIVHRMYADAAVNVRAALAERGSPSPVAEGAFGAPVALGGDSLEIILDLAEPILRGFLNAAARKAIALGEAFAREHEEQARRWVEDETLAVLDATIHRLQGGVIFPR